MGEEGGGEKEEGEKEDLELWKVIVPSPECVGSWKEISIGTSQHVILRDHGIIAV